MGMLGGKPWADGPFELISPAKYGFTVGQPLESPFVGLHALTAPQVDKKPEGADIMAAEMIAVHNAILRAVNAVYLQAAKVEASGDDALTTAFANFARLWGEMIEEHHKTEEEMLFPELEALVGAPGSMTPNVEQHHQFEAGLTLYRRYIGDVVEGKQKFNAARLKEVIDSFMPVVTTHLHDEIATLKGLRQYSDNADWDGYMKALGAKLRARGPPDAMVSTVCSAVGAFL